ncbi:MAG: beta-ketoacyl synthase chain length factor [Pseudomonadota bacterium]
MNVDIYVNALGFCGPGVGSVDALSRAFAGENIDVPADWRPEPETLPRRQARRLSAATLTAMAAAEQVAGVLTSEAPWVFASSCGEGDTLNTILAALCQPEIMLQPVRFQNAVHNAAQGQFSIVAGSTGPATSIAAFDDSVAAGLLKCLMQMQIEQTVCGLVAFDEPLPPPLHERRPYDLTLAGALALSPQREEGSIARLSVSSGGDRPVTDPAALRGPSHILTSNNPVRFLLPVLAAVRGIWTEPVVLALPGGGTLAFRAEVL